jgi:tetratricopeptide (TPR) repeat protein/predicted Ser/Thr protein kinase
VTPGQQISRYRIQRPLGKGGMGVVYLAEDTRLNRLVALKFLASDSLNEHDKLRFLNEARAAASIRHPNICPIHDIEEAEGRLFISMDYLEGETLDKRLLRGPIPVTQAVDIAIQIARGLDKAHGLGTVHRDIKSANIILGPDGHVSILDFGLALLPGAERLTVTGAVVGTPVYMSPEQCQGHEVDHSTDIWSLGVLLFEMLTGVLPFRRQHVAATAHSILQDPVPSIAACRPDAPEALQQVVEKALEKRPAQRWSSVREFENALLPFAAETGRAASSETDTQTMYNVAAPGSSAAQRHGRSKRFAIAAVAAGMALLVATVSYQWTRSRGGAAETPASAPAQNSAEKLIAILPFEVLGSSVETSEIANGLAEILTAALSDLERIDRHIATIPGSEIRRRNISSPAEARRIYGANLVVTGTAQPHGTRVQFALALVDPVKLRQLGARGFDYDPQDPVGARKTAVEELAGLLSLNKESARASATGGETATPAASSAYLKGRGFLARYDVAGNLDQAIEHFERAVQFDPRYALAHGALGEALWRKSRASGDAKLAARALEHGERAVQLDPTLPKVRTSLAAIYTTSGREEDAVRELKEALKIAPGSAEASRELARVYTSQGRLSEAEAAYREAIAARPTDWYGYLLLGLLHNEKREYDKAIAVFKQARDLTPDNELIYRNLGASFLAAGQYDEAVSHLQQSLKLKPSATTYASLGAAYFRRRRYADALAAVETALDLDPKRYYFWGNLGIYCKWNPGSEGRSRPAFEKAIELAGKFLEVSPSDHDVRADLGEYYARLGNKAAALAEIAKIPEAARPSRMGRIAIVYEFTGNRAKAIPFLTATLKNPAGWYEIRDDPDLARLWSDPAVQKLVRSR